MNSGQGFTLIELVVTLAVAGVLISVAVPSYRNLVISNRLSATANDYVAALSEARLEAIRRNVNIQFCGTSGNGSDTLGAGCDTAGGEIASLDNDGDILVSRTSPTVRANLTLASVEALRYSGQGIARSASSGGAPYSGLVVDLASDQISNGNRRCIYLATGSSITTCTVTNAETCPANEPTPCQ